MPSLVLGGAPVILSANCSDFLPTYEPMSARPMPPKKLLAGSGAISIAVKNGVIAPMNLEPDPAIA